MITFLACLPPLALVALLIDTWLGSDRIDAGYWR